MSKPIVIIVIAVTALVAAGGAYHFMSQEPAATAPATAERIEPPVNPTPSPAKPDHGNFQKRFQPSMPPAK